MEEEIDEPRKICPVCSRPYSGNDSYCSNDGTALVLAGSAQAPVAETVLDTNPDLGAPPIQPKETVN